MELWIRSQDKMKLVKCDSLVIIEMEGLGIYRICDNFERNIAEYKTKERALEILDEIQSKLKGTFLMKMRDEKYSKYIEDGKKYLENLNGIGIVTGDACFDIEPINKSNYVYEMPEE